MFRPDRRPPPVAAVAPPVPASPSIPPEPPSLAPPSEPVYLNPKIGIVHLRAHQDADGRLLGPQIMYQVTDPGGWNVEAVERGEGYIPAVNIEVPPNAGSPYVVPARAAGSAPLDSPLVDPDAAADIVITGLMSPEEKPQAEAMAREAGGGRIAVFDPQAGWLLLPARLGH